MTNGRRWLALDADIFAKRFTHDLHDRFGFAGVVVWVAFLCACKQSKTPGWVRMANDLDGMSKLGLVGYDLVDTKGEPWTLTEFFDFTGRKKQTRRVAVQRPDTRRIAAARLLDIGATHWEHWQDAGRRAAEAERKSRSRGPKRPDNVRTHPGHRPDKRPDTGRTNVRPDSDSDSDIPQTPPGAEPPDPRTNSRKNGTNPRARGTNPRSKAAEPHRETVPEWQPDQRPDEPPIDRAALDALRAEHGWTKPETTDG